MGKAGKWFRSLLSSKKLPQEPNTAAPANERKKGKCALSKSGDNSVKFKNADNPLASPYHEGLDANKHAIAVAAATAAVAEAALAAAQAAAEVVKLTSGGGSLRSGTAYLSCGRRRMAAALKIQSAFRAYLARRALRALKGLVKLQALVRGHIVRKQSADMLRRMQAMARIQARASATRESCNTKTKLPNSHHQGFVNLMNYAERSNIAKHDESTLKQYNSRSYGTSSINNKQGAHLASQWLDQWMERNAWHNNHDDEGNDKILEVDTWKPRHNARRNDRTTPAWNGLPPRLPEKHLKMNPSISSEEVASVTSEKILPESPIVHSASSRPTRGPFTPTRSECSGDHLGGHPSYMAKTESSRAKVRSQSAPKQRMQLEQLGLSWKFGRSLWGDSDVLWEKRGPRPVNSTSPGYSNSGNFRRTHDTAGGYGYSSSYGHRI